jgi:Fic family protein
MTHAILRVMDESIFDRTRMTGGLVPIYLPAQGEKFAFVPDPLPPTWRWPESLWPLVVDARAALASLDGTGKHLPNPEILLQPLHRREAQLSSKLEGTITDPEQQVLFELAPIYPTSPQDPANAFREVYNYRRALRFQLEGNSGLPLSLRLIRNLHALLLEGVRGADQTPGEFRTIQNQIGRPARFVPPPPEYLNQALSDLEAYLHTQDHFDPLVRAFLVHYQFETIHPFRDGNGRVGRLLLALTISEWCGLSNQWLYMSPYFEKNKVRYMDTLLAVSTQGAWEDWIRFCLEGVVEQARDAEKRCDQLLSLHRQFHSKLTGSARLSRAVDLLFANPVMTVNQYKSQFSVTHATARSDLRKLETQGIVRELERRVLITYFCPQIFSITYQEI